MAFLSTPRTALTRLLLSCGLAAMLCGGQARGDEKTYLLRYKFQPNQFLYYEVENPHKIETKYKEVTQTESNLTQIWKQLRVVSVDAEGNALLEPMIERVRLSMGGELIYDSLEPEDPPVQFRLVKESVGKVTARVNVSTTGELNQVIPVAQDNPALVEAAKKNDPQLNFLVILSKTPVRIGDTWKDRFTSEVTVDKGLKQNVTIQRAYTLAAVNGSIASIKLKTSVIPPTDDPQIQLQLIERTPSGVIEFDIDKGLIVSIETQIDETVYNPFGPGSSIAAATKFSEKLLPGRPEFKTARRSANTLK